MTDRSSPQCTVFWPAIWQIAFGMTLAAHLSLSAHADEPIKIGFSTSLTGTLASSGKANLLAQQIWQEKINAKGGLLGRPGTARSITTTSRKLILFPASTPS